MLTLWAQTMNTLNAHQPQLLPHPTPPPDVFTLILHIVFAPPPYSFDPTHGKYLRAPIDR